VQAQQEAKKALAELKRCEVQLMEAEAAREDLADEVAKLNAEASHTERNHQEDLESVRKAGIKAEDAVKALQKRVQVCLKHTSLRKNGS
jgi:predicted  nucleic acid-binding Zn-ribbon protein